MAAPTGAAQPRSRVQTLVGPTAEVPNTYCAIAIHVDNIDKSRRQLGVRPEAALGCPIRQQHRDNNQRLTTAKAGCGCQTHSNSSIWAYEWSRSSPGERASEGNDGAQVVDGLTE